MSSIHGDLQKIRPPRVHIRYDVQVGNAIERRELPFVVGVLADLSGLSKDKPKLKKRKYVEINRMNFDQIMAGIKPSLKINVRNLIQNNDTELAFQLEFKGMDDFKPVRVAEKIAEKVKPFAQTLELRRQIKKLLMAMDGNDGVHDVIQHLINDPAALKQLCNEAGRGDLETQEEVRP
jgi:type VI secretion system protein ImpB